jgi:hypothetical protein
MASAPSRATISRSRAAAWATASSNEAGSSALPGPAPGGRTSALVKRSASSTNP